MTHKLALSDFTDFEVEQKIASEITATEGLKKQLVCCVDVNTNSVRYEIRLGDGSVKHLKYFLNAIEVYNDS